MLARVRALRKHLAKELGFIIPPVHITDNLRLKPREYIISLRNAEMARWQTEGNQLLAVNADPKARALPGTETREPAFGVPARWIQPSLSEQAMAAGYSVVDPTTVIATHLGEVIRREAHRLLGRAETKRLLDSLQETHPKLIEELVPKLMTLGEVQRVLQQLLREQVSIRDLGSLLEVMVEAAATNKNTGASGGNDSPVDGSHSDAADARWRRPDARLRAGSVAGRGSAGHSRRRKRTTFAGGWKPAIAQRNHISAPHRRVVEANDWRSVELG